MKDKNHDYLNRCRKSIWQNSASFHDNESQQPGHRSTVSHIVKAIYDKAIANIIFKCEKMKGFSPKLGKRQWHPLSPPVFNIVLKVLAREIGQEKEK